MAERDKEMETLRTEFRKLIGGAIIQGLMEPGAMLAAAHTPRQDYSQDATGNYTQIGGNHEQVGGNYDQSASTQPSLNEIAIGPTEVGRS